MWLFTGPYGHYGPAMVALAVGLAATAIGFTSVASRLISRTDLSVWRVTAVLVVVMTAALLSERLAFAEPVFVGNRLNRGAALMLAMVGIVLGAAGIMASHTRRLLGVLLLVTASAVLFGDIAGWLRRSAGQTYVVAPRRNNLST